MSAERDYWRECVEAAFNDAGIKATDEQIESVAGDFEGAHDNYGMAFHQPSAGSYYRDEIDKLNRELERERSKEFCRECNGRGRIVSHGPIHSSDSECWKCHGHGKVSP